MWLEQDKVNLQYRNQLKEEKYRWHISRSFISSAYKECYSQSSTVGEKKELFLFIFLATNQESSALNILCIYIDILLYFTNVVFGGKIEETRIVGYENIASIVLCIILSWIKYIGKNKAILPFLLLLLLLYWSTQTY